MNDLVSIHVDGHKGWLTMNRPDKLNALSRELVAEMKNGLDQLSENENVKVIVLSGEGKSFCAGGDIASMNDIASSSEAAKWVEYVSSLSRKILEIDKYVVAAIHGYAAGAGFSLALACDFIIAKKDAKFALSFSNIGLIPDLGLIRSLSERVPSPIAKEWISSSKIVTAVEAHEQGIVNRLTEGSLYDEVTDFTKFIEEGPNVVNKYVKFLINHIDDASLDNYFMTENIIQTTLLQTYDHKEGVQAFFEKRKPHFQGR
ncbi:enoyl-CoA hydratase [Thalassobacillus devorans]|uniref:Enoyl-CoA hydratase n=1 Tax=Thalassobacillus devorans TaxID=279813 RepID=A0ABQ1P226_9BACI|nr:enoyl-CoA hydratase/isomerase family protein [Thalassobacillus devorans]NIK28026.1 2-(1,2-epoxy-1,2-dihydrophenyl)acetyl-CoA isomerase [Thalassobacillus devorans]GGC89489.1 enoyl-CoA hydratase [Thalassobacillus devorans]